MTVQTGCDSAYNVASTHLCGLAFGAGDDIAAVESICGQPVAQTKQDYTFSETELTYGGDDSQTIVFQDGKLVDWK
jgi:hypothetical protein